MKLYYKPGACSMAAHIVLNEAKAAYTLVKVDTSAGVTETGADFTAINARGYVPALELEDGVIITENTALLQYLADQYPSLKLAPPAGEMARVRLQEVLSYVSSELHKAFSPFFAAPAMTDDAKSSALEQLSRKIGHIEAMLADGRPYLTGPQITIADIYAFVVLNWTNFIGVSLEPWPKTTALVARVAERPSVQLALKEEGLVA